MTEPPSPDFQTLDYVSPTPRRSLLPIFVSWIVILASVAFVAERYFARSQAPVANAASSDPPVGQLLITSRYVVGAKAFWPAGKDPGAIFKMYMDQVDHFAKTPTDRLRVIPVAGELIGEEEALRRLDALRSATVGTSLDEDRRDLLTLYAKGESLPPQIRQRLIDRHGWFGMLALSYKHPASDPIRHEVIRQAQRTLFALVGMGFVSFVGFGIGLVLLVLAIVWWADRRLRPAYRPFVGDTSAFLEGFAIFMGGYVGFGLLLHYLGPRGDSETAHIGAMFIPVIVALLWPRLRGVSIGEWRAGLGWHTGRGLLREIVAGWIGYIAGLPILALGMLITLILIRRTGVEAMHPIINDANGTASAAIRIFLLAALWAPLVEESLFRGLLFHHLRSRHAWWISAAIVSVLFAAIHPQGWAGLPVLIAIALVLAGIREWRGSIFASAAAHALNNATVTVMLVIATS